MALRGKGALFVWTDIPAEDERGFNDWYNREHLRSRALEVPGFLRGRRYVATGEGRRYAALYEADDVGVFASDAYLAVVAEPDERSRYYIPRFRDPIRSVGRIAASFGEGEGGFAGFLTLAPASGRDVELRQWLSDTLLPKLVTRHNILGAHLIEADAGANAASAGRHLRAANRSIDWLVVIEATTVEDLAALAPEFSGERLALHGAAPEVGYATLKLVYSLARSVG